MNNIEDKTLKKQLFLKQRIPLSNTRNEDLRESNYLFKRLIKESKLGERTKRPYIHPISPRRIDYLQYTKS